MKKSIISLCVVFAMLSMVAIIGCDKFLKIVSVKTNQYSNLKSTSVVLKGNVVSTGSEKQVEERGFYYSTSKTLKDAVTVECGAGGKGEFEAKITGLKPGTKYYYKAYAKNNDDIDAGEIIEFTTFKLDFTLETLPPERVASGRVILHGSYVNNENLKIDKVGFEYGFNGDFTNATAIYASETDTPFSVTLEDLPRGTYYCRALVQAEDSTILLFGNSQSFDSYEHVATVVTTGDANNITATSAHLTGTVTGENIDANGFYWSKNSDFSSPNQEICGLGAGSIDVTLDSLTSSTTYYYKAYAVYTIEGVRNEALGEMKSFTTLNAK
ncbi:MAG: hypothetical protein IK025_06945 [Bacteroidales bacterium]|nr:hypothetical protein [Bacteroidales bacterium]